MKKLFIIFSKQRHAFLEQVVSKLVNICFDRLFPHFRLDTFILGMVESVRQELQTWKMISPKSNTCQSEYKYLEKYF